MSDDRSTPHGRPVRRPCRAFAHVRGMEIAFTQSGCGETVVVAVGLDDVSMRALEARLAARYTVVVPDATCVASASQDRAWLCEFVDCLGLRRAHLVAMAPVGLSAVDVALVDFERFERIVVLTREGSHRTITPGGRLAEVTLGPALETPATTDALTALALFLESGALDDYAVPQVPPP